MGKRLAEMTADADPVVGGAFQKVHGVVGHLL
jgi:hypothetical protein